MEHKTFATAINCMDGRTQIPVTEWLKQKYNVDYVDMITEPGPNKIIADAKSDSDHHSIKRRVDISVNKHFSKVIAIVGHHDCAGNPVEQHIQIKHIHAAKKIIESWGYGAEVVGLWVDENWKVNLVE